MKAPVITILTPVYNGLPFLRECAASVLSQTFQDWEWVISDNGSSDGTRDYLKTLTDPRIRVFPQPANLGIFGNLNFLFENARAPLAQILCADDLFSGPSSLGVIVDYWKTAPEKIGFARFNHEGQGQCSLTSYCWRNAPPVLTPAMADLWFFLFGNLAGNLSNVTVRTALVENAGKFRLDLPYAGDWEFWARAAAVSGMGICPDKVVTIRRHEGVASRYLNKKGELLGQKAAVAGELYRRLAERFPDTNTLLRVHATLNGDGQQRWTALRRLLKGDPGYLRELDRVSGGASHMLSRPMRWALFGITLGARIGRVRLARKILRRLEGRLSPLNAC